jgi:adenylate cyclase class 2
MNKEIEAKFININKEELVNKLKPLGFEKTKPRFLMKRRTFDIPKAPRGTFVRLRQEVDKITLTYKSLKKLTIDGMSEIELVVSDFDNTAKFLEAIGMMPATFEENYRETYFNGDVEITFDEWPGLPVFIEIEGPDKQKVEDTVNELGLSMEEALYGNVDEVYKRLKEVDISNCREITFENSPC